MRDPRGEAQGSVHGSCSRMHTAVVRPLNDLIIQLYYGFHSINDIRRIQLLRKVQSKESDFLVMWLRKSRWFMPYQLVHTSGQKARDHNNKGIPMCSMVLLVEKLKKHRDITQLPL